MLDLLISESPTDAEVEASLTGFVHRVQRYLYRIGITTFEYDEDKLVTAHELSMRLLHHYINPSCFKAAAAMTIGVGAARPFTVELPATIFTKTSLYPNAIFSILESVYWMHGAELLLPLEKGPKKLEAEIGFSDHFFDEFVIATGKLGAITNPDYRISTDEERVRFRLLALNYEALAYQKNDHCKYDPPKELHLEKYLTTLSD